MTGLLFQHPFTMLHLNLDCQFSPVTSQRMSILQNVVTFHNTRQILITEENNHLVSHVSWYLMKGVIIKFLDWLHTGVHKYQVACYQGNFIWWYLILLSVKYEPCFITCFTCLQLLKYSPHFLPWCMTITHTTGGN
jgi:hypothetical protein